MVQPGIGGLDTPRTNIGDATYLSRQPDFDISQELSFQSPSKDANVLQQLRDGSRPNLRTPRGGGGGSRAPFADKRNLPAGLNGAEFTPLLKSATRNNGSRRHGGGKENGVTATPAFLNRIDEDMTPMPVGETSVYGAGRNTSSYMENTPLPAEENSSAASTPIVMRRRIDAKGPLEDGNHLSLKEQENVIDRIEKENFGLKLKIHFLEEALRKAGPGFSDAALKENTELKVDKVTMQRELQRYKKHLSTAEKDLEGCRHQILEVQEKARRKFADENQRAEVERLNRLLEDREAELEDMQRQIDQGQKENAAVEKLQDDIGDLESELRRKEELIDKYEDELEEFRAKAEEGETRAQEAERRAEELEGSAPSEEELEEAKGTIEDLETDVRRLEQQLDDANEKLKDAVDDKDRAEADLAELQEDMADKSMVTKGLSRQVEEKLIRLQNELEQAREDYSSLVEQNLAKEKETENLRSQLRETRQEHDSVERIRQSLASRLEEAQLDKNSKSDEKALLQTRNDALRAESDSLQREVERLQKAVSELEDSLSQERHHANQIEHDIQSHFKEEIERLNDEISDLQAQGREKDNLYDNDSDKWETDRQTLESERDRAEERAAGLQKTVDRLRATEGDLSSKEEKLQEAIQSETERHKGEAAVLTRRIDELQHNLESRQTMLEDLRTELSSVRDELRQTQLDFRAQSEKAEALEDEVEILQATIDEESERAQKDLEQAQQQSKSLEKELSVIRGVAESAKVTSAFSEEATKQTSETLARLKFQLADSTDSLAKANREKIALQQQVASVNIDFASTQAALALAEAERDELESELDRLRLHGEDTFKLDQERLDLRSTKTRLDVETRRLRDENKALVDQRRSLEKSLDDEIEKAAAEEDRLNGEIIQLQAKMRQLSDSQDATSARRTIRELERRLEDYEAKLAVAQFIAPGANGDGASEISILHRDLTAARHKEREFLQREASHRDTVKALKRQMADLERKAHDTEVNQLMMSPSTHEASAQKGEVSELRRQLSIAHKSAHELKRSLRDADQRIAATGGELQLRLEEVEEQKIVVEEALEDAQAAAEETAVAHERAIQKYKSKLEKYKQDRDEQANRARNLELRQRDNTISSDMSIEERRDLHMMLRESQTEADKLDRQAREQQEALEELMAVELNLRKKLDRARSERAAYRASAEKLQKDVRALKATREHAEKHLAGASGDDLSLVHIPQGSSRNLVNTGAGDIDTDAIIRGVEAAERRHEKEIRGLVMHMEWIKACWDREASFRTDGMFVKQYLLKEIEIRDACNKADLAILNRIRAEINPKFRPAMSQLCFTRVEKNNLTKSAGKRGFRLKHLLIAARFIARTRIAARDWSKHEALRQRLADAYDQQEREQRISRMRDEWRAQMAAKKLIVAPGA